MRKSVPRSVSETYSVAAASQKAGEAQFRILVQEELHTVRWDVLGTPTARLVLLTFACA